MSKENSVQKFYKDNIIFVTGAFGLMGKVLVEKLLYSCSDLKEILVLVRPKRGISELQRLDELIKLPIFTRILKEKPEVLSKITPVFGDVTKFNLGLSDDHIGKVLNSNLVFHVAASLKLEYTLKPNILLNLVGTKNVIEVAKKMNNLNLMVHFSTGFCCPEQEILEEEIVDWPFDDPNEIIKISEWLNEGAMAKLQPHLLKTHPNTYTYTKRLAEILCKNEYEKGLPICIVRPSIVIPAYQEPLVGWVDSLNGPAGLMIGAAKGVIRSMLVDGETETEAIPVDIAINGIIMIAKIIGSNDRSSKIEVYNVTASPTKKRTLRYVLEAAKKINFEVPAQIGLWFPNGEITSNKLRHKINVVLFHWLPAYIIDFFLFCFRQKRFMIRVQTKISQGLEVLQFFTMRNWIFKSEKFQGIVREQSPDEYKMFFIDTASVPDNFEDQFLKNTFLGGRLYLLKEPHSTIPRARIQMKIAYVVDKLCKFLFLFYLMKFLLNTFGLMSLVEPMIQKFY